ncbi:Rne/Rng family ribonuclease [Novosphingobium sp. SCN 63-17]|uniref:ribonuclease n=1 Tax=Novosphingobium sp. SCN 63-17 TaxID=1660120 RepID=UPI00086D5484|nr:ribonuclease [Novosphingobium sp. SCN 63-17]ODU81591.1 MAG: ribonuclease [Novosphingobium sp. SCN 63-17]
MAEWLHEAGIGEERAILVERGEIIAARVDWGETLRPGFIGPAQIVVKHKGTRRGIARFTDDGEALVDGLDPAITEGATLLLRVTRAAIAEKGRTKLPQARPAPPESLPSPAPGLLAELRVGPLPVRSLPITDRSFDEAGWHELVEQAQGGEIAFPGGSLLVSPTPAMTLIDIDGTLPPPLLARAAVPAIARALTRLDIGGSIGIDFPTLADRKDRLAVDAALTEALAGWKGERTAMNGFGFVQLVARLERPSLVARFARYRTGAALRALLRQAERVLDPGVLLLTAAPTLRRAMPAEWEAELVRRTGRIVRWQEDAGLALDGGFAQAVAA